MSADGGEAQRITHNGGFEAKESPDGQYLFYLASVLHTAWERTLRPS